MKCLFCKQTSEQSTSEEHIIPASLGNKGYVLPRGIVCDKCNNYFAVKIEKPVLENAFFKSLRFRNNIHNRKKKLPKGTALVPQTGFRADISVSEDDERSLKIVVDDASFPLPN